MVMLDVLQITKSQTFKNGLKLIFDSLDALNTAKRGTVKILAAGRNSFLEKNKHFI